MVTQSPPSSEVCGSNPRPYVGKLEVAYQWLAVYSTKSWKLGTNGWQFRVQNLDQLHVLVSSAHKTTCRDMTYTVLKVMLKRK